jgi:hypothetical protein
MQTLPENCRCDGCGGRNLVLTNRRRERPIRTLGGQLVLSVALASCSACGRTERVLPCDALPGKQFSIDAVLAAVTDAQQPARMSLRRAAARVGATAGAVTSWCRGLANRLLDLFPIVSHRASVARPTDGGTLVPFSAFVAEVLRREPDARGPAWSEGASELASFIEGIGGPLPAARFAARVFRAPVLSFRSADLGTWIEHAPRGFAPENSQGDCSAVPTLRDRNAGTGPAVPGAGADQDQLCRSKLVPSP